MMEAVIPRPPPSSTHWPSKFESSLFRSKLSLSTQLLLPEKESLLFPRSQTAQQAFLKLLFLTAPFCNSDMLELPCPVFQMVPDMISWRHHPCSSKTYLSCMLGTSTGLRSKKSPGGICGLWFCSRVWDAHVRGW